MALVQGLQYTAGVIDTSKQYGWIRIWNKPFRSHNTAGCLTVTVVPAGSGCHAFAGGVLTFTCVTAVAGYPNVPTVSGSVVET